MAEFEILNKLYEVKKQERLLHISLDEVEANIHNAIVFARRFDFRKAMQLVNSIISALQTYPRMNKSTELLAVTYTILGDINRDRGNIIGKNGAFLAYRKAYNLFKELEKIERMGTLLVYIGSCCEMMKKYNFALHFFNLAIEIGNTVPSLYRVKSMAYTRIGCVLTKLGYFQSAEKNLHKAIYIREIREYFNDSTYIRHKLAITHLKQGKFDDAYSTVNNSEAYTTRNPFRKTQTLILLTDISFSAGEFDFGLELAVEAESLANEFEFAHQKKVLNEIFEKQQHERN